VLPPVTKPPVVPLALDEFGKTAAAQPCFTMNWPSSRASLYAAFGTRKPAAKLASIPSIAWMSCRAVCSTKRQRRAAANSSRLTTDGLFGEAKRDAAGDVAVVVHGWGIWYFCLAKERPDSPFHNNATYAGDSGVLRCPVEPQD